MAVDDRAATLAAFKAAVNMTAGELDKWLATGESRAVGVTHGEGAESVGHHSGRRIVDLLRKHDAELTEGDLAHMRKVVGYVHRHLAQGGPQKDKEHSPWRYSLMNWGHDPLVKH